MVELIVDNLIDLSVVMNDEMMNDENDYDYYYDVLNDSIDCVNEIVNDFENENDLFSNKNYSLTGFNNKSNLDYCYYLHYVFQTDCYCYYFDYLSNY